MSLGHAVMNSGGGERNSQPTLGMVFEAQPPPHNSPGFLVQEGAGVGVMVAYVLPPPYKSLVTNLVTKSVTNNDV